MEVVLFYCLFLFQIELKVLGFLFLLETHRYMHVSGKKIYFTLVMHHVVKVGLWKSGKPVECK